MSDSDALAEVSLSDLPQTSEQLESELANSTGLVVSHGQEAQEEQEEESSQEEEQEEINPLLFLELGDRVLIDSEEFGRTIGRIYYRDAELIRIMPDGATNILLDFPRIYNEDEGIDKFDDDMGVSVSYVLEKANFPSFVEQQDFHVGQQLETLTQSGERSETILTILSINSEEDKIVVQDQTGAEETIVFGFVGIPLDEDFKILRILKQPKLSEAAAAQEEAVPEAASQEAPEEDEELVDEGEEFEIAYVGKVAVAKDVIIRQAKETEKTYTDTIQKVDALNDFMTMLDPIAQKDPRAIRAVRILVETLFNMKQETIQFYEDGSIAGPATLSVDMLADLLKNTNVPMSRPVLDIALKIYLDDQDEFDLDKDEFYSVDFEKELAAAIARVNPVVSSDGQVNMYRIGQHAFIKKFEETWRPNNTGKPVHTFQEDADFFRLEVPDVDDPPLNGLSYSRETKTAGEEPYFTDINYSVRRGLTRTYYKAGNNRKTQLVPADLARAKAYLLFPYSTASTIGSTRTSFLAIDSARSQMKKELMNDILERFEGPKDSIKGEGILTIKSTGESIGNIEIRDYLSQIPFVGTGISDAQITLVELGLNNYELTPAILATIDSKLQAYQKQLRNELVRLREALVAPTSEPEQNSLLADPQVLAEIIRSEPILVDTIIELEKQTSIKPSDIAIVAYLLKTHNDYFQAAMGQQALYVARERLRATRDRFLAAVHLSQLLAKKRQEAGVPPKPNKCEHVAKLAEIRRIEDENERMMLLVKFFAKYQGARQDNFINCSICKQHLLCVHERLQIQGFLNPAENPNIEKEIILNFAGGQFQGNYICRNCGQPIKEISYDTNLEYDDNGKPMMGRAVLVDTDAILEEQLDIALSSVPIPKVKELKLKTKKEELYRDIVHELAGRVGIALSENAYRRIIDRMVQYVMLLPTAEVYNADAAKKKKEGKDVVDYDIIVSRNVICAAAVFLLVEIQTRIPEYTVRYPLHGCVATFEGYPLGSETNMGGMTYIACAVASVMRKETPWNKTGFQSGKTATDRQNAVLQYMSAILAKVRKINPTVEQDLIFKRAYLETRAAQEVIERQTEKIPDGFLPNMITLEPAEAANGENTVVAEVASRMGAAGEQALAEVWIRQANSLAKKTAIVIRGSPVAGTTCCLASITSPGNFWLAASDLPQLAKRTMKPNYRVHPLRVHFVPRPLQEIIVEADDSLNYRLFLKVCYTGPQKGQLHEVGLTNVCRWCGFSFPSHPAIVDADEKSDGQSSVTSQGIDTSRKAFQDLLDEVHRHNQVEPYKAVAVPTVEQITSEFANMTPQPFEGWFDAIQQTFEELIPAVQTGRQVDVINALGPLSNIAASAEAIVRRRIVDSLASHILKLMSELSWDNLLQALNTYFLVPYKRMLVNYNIESYKDVVFKPVSEEGKRGFGKKRKNEKPVGIDIPYSEYINLPDDHKDDINKIMDIDTGFIKTYMPLVNKLQNAKLKLEHFVDCLSTIYSFKEKIHSGVLPGRSTTLKYIQEVLFFGILADLVNPDIMPSMSAGGATSSDMGMTSELLMKIVVGSLKKFNKERMSFSDEELREKITVRNEKEKADIISQFDKMSKDEKEVQLLMKANRMGRWAVGGTKAIWAYDAERYGIEKIERLEAGLIDFPGREPTDIPGREYDDSGLPIMGDEAGYDVMQEGEDDA